LSYNFKACKNDLAILAMIMEGKEALSIDQVSAERLLTNIQTLISDLNLPSRPSELGIRKQDARILLKNTLIQTRRIKTNPRPLDDELFSYIEKGI
jgi:alcohol dehydrogenase class IV